MTGGFISRFISILNLLRALVRLTYGLAATAVFAHNIYQMLMIDRATN
jgi:hypothetical protein